MAYCTYVAELPLDDPDRLYHDTQYGFPLESDDELFGRLILEINQAGLSWRTILKKADNFRKSYSNFQIKEIANYDEKDRSRLLNDAGIIKNRLKVNAVIYNAQQILKIQSEYVSFKAFLDDHRALSKAEWVKLFKKHFKFTGGEITGEFLMSTAYLEGAHMEACPIFQKIRSLDQET